MYSLFHFSAKSAEVVARVKNPSFTSTSKTFDVMEWGSETAGVSSRVLGMETGCCHPKGLTDRRNMFLGEKHETIRKRRR